MKKLHIALLGRFSATWESRPVALSESPARLLAYLALSYGRPVSRSRVAGALWPDLSEVRARANLSTTIWRLRRAVSEHGGPVDIVQVSADSVGLNTDRCDVDVEDFSRGSMSPGSHAFSLDALACAAHALEPYRGDLLEDWDVEWCRLEREELHQRYIQTLQALSEGFEQRGRDDLAMQYARQAAQADPFNEAAQRTLMRLLYRTGDKTSAVTQFNRFAHIAKSELGVEPAGETIALVREIRRPSSLYAATEPFEFRVPVSIRPERVPMVGRDLERLELSALLDSTAAGTGGGLLLIGEAGIGKSRLADWVMEEWAARGGAAGRGRCIEFNDPVPYQPLLDALDSFVDEGDLSGFVSGDGRAPTTHLLDEALGGTVGQTGTTESSWPPGKLRLFARLRSCVEDASRHRSLLVVVEDLQWADAGTVDFLAYLLDRARNMRLALLLTSRPSGGGARHSSSLERLSRHCVGTSRLGPLSIVDTTRLVKSLLDRSEASPDLAGWVYAETEGNPLFVVETLRLLQRQGNVETSPGKVFGDSDRSIFAGPSASIPEGVRSAVEQRLALIEPTFLRVAQIASVLGRSFDDDLLGTVVGARRNRLSRATGHLLQDGIFEREGAGYRFSHDKIRAVCYESLSTRARRTFHARAAAALVQLPDVPIHRLAWHQHSAGQWNLATSSWEQAGDQAREIYAYEEALRVYHHAMACVRRDFGLDSQAMDLAEIRILVKSDAVLAVLGKPEDRKAILGRMGVLAQQVSQPPVLATWCTRRALLEEHVGNFRFAAVLARRAWGISRSAGDRPGEIESLRVLAWALTRVGRYRRSLAVSQLALRRLAGTKSASTVAILWQASNAYIQLSDYVSATAYTDRARSISVELGNVGLVPILTLRGIVDRLTGDVKASRRSLLAALRIATETGEPIAAARVGVQLATLDALEGRLGDALQRLREAVVASRVTGYVRMHVSCLNEVAYSVGRLIGNYRWAWNASNHALSLCRMLDNKVLSASYRDTQARVLFDEGRIEEAMTAVSEALQVHEDERWVVGTHLESLALRGAILLRLGHTKHAIADLEAARRGQSQAGERLLLVDTLCQLALAYAGAGDADGALATSNEALQLLAEMNYANFQPQRIFWHHYQILEMFQRGPRLPYLKRAVEFVEAQAATLSKAQARRLRRDVRLNREILEAWERHQKDPETAQPQTAPPVDAATVQGSVVSAS